MHVAFSKGSDRASYSELLKENGLAGMLEAKDIRTVDNLSPTIAGQPFSSYWWYRR